MASAIFPSSGLPVLHSPTYYSKNPALAFSPSQFFSPNSVVKLKREIVRPTLNFKKLTNRVPTVVSAHSNFLRVVQTVLKVGKDGVEAGTNLIPDSIPRPLARIAVSVVGLSVGLFVLKSFISTAIFVLATMGLIYFTFIALNKNEGPKIDSENGTGTKSVDDSIEEARRIMDKYK